METFFFSPMVEHSLTISSRGCDPLDLNFVILVSEASYKFLTGTFVPLLLYAAVSHRDEIQKSLKKKKIRKKTIELCTAQGMPGQKFSLLYG